MAVSINDTYDRFTELTEAICYWLGYQTNIGRKQFIHEASLRYPIADAITKDSIAINQVKLESVHPLFKGKRVDLTIFQDISDEETLTEMHEFKIAKYTSEKGDEHQRVFNDIVRLGYYNLVSGKECYFLMCGSFDDFRQHFVGDKPMPVTSKDGTISINQRNTKVIEWKPNGIYKDWFMFEQKKDIEITFDNTDTDFGLHKFKSNYNLSDKLKDTDTDFYNSNEITLKTTCMSITSFGSQRTHAAGIWKIEMNKN